MSQLDNKVAYITGGSKGIGLGIAKALTGLGMRVAISSRHLQEAEKAATLFVSSQLVFTYEREHVLSIHIRSLITESITCEHCRILGGALLSRRSKSLPVSLRDS